MRSIRQKWMAFGCAMLALTLFCVGFVRPGLMEENNVHYLRYTVGEADQWETPRFPLEFEEGFSEEALLEALDRWWSAREARSRCEIPRIDRINAFAKKSVRAFLEAEGSGNFVFSPISLWLCANLLSDLTAGETRQQLLSLLESKDETERLEQLDAVWKALYWDDGRNASVPSAAIWLNERVEISESTLNTLTGRDHASVYRGSMGEADYDAALQAWINEKTRDLLMDMASGLRFAPDSSLSVCAAFYFRAMWESTFDADDTAPDVFYAQDGPVDADFMHISERGTVFQGEGFSAYLKPFRDGGCAALVLPDEGMAPEDLLRSDELFRLLAEKDHWERCASGLVNLSLPKLDLSGGFSMEEGLRELGITDVFDTEAADFEGCLSSDTPITLSSPRQLCRLTMNEDGVEAAALTISDVFGAMAMPEAEIDLVLDRPFVFAVMDDWGLPLFIGLVHKP